MDISFVLLFFFNEIHYNTRNFKLENVAENGTWEGKVKNNWVLRDLTELLLALWRIPGGVFIECAVALYGSVGKPGFSFQPGSLFGFCVFRMLLICLRFKYIISHFIIIPKVRVLPVAYKFTLDIRNMGNGFLFLEFIDLCLWSTDTKIIIVGNY